MRFSCFYKFKCYSCTIISLMMMMMMMVLWASTGMLEVTINDLSTGFEKLRVEILHFIPVAFNMINAIMNRLTVA